MLDRNSFDVLISNEREWRAAFDVKFRVLAHTDKNNPLRGSVKRITTAKTRR